MYKHSLLFCPFARDLLRARVDVRVSHHNDLVSVEMRIDSRKKGVHVDIRTMSFLPWESISGIQGVASINEARWLAAEWALAAREQQTVQPRMSHV